MKGQGVITGLRDIAETMRDDNAEMRLPKDVGSIIFDHEEEEGWEYVNAGMAVRWFRDRYKEGEGEGVDDDLMNRLTMASHRADESNWKVMLPVEIVNRVEGKVHEPASAGYWDIHGPAGEAIQYLADMMAG